MHTWSPRVLVTVAILACTATANQARESEPGERLFRQYCASCHGEKGMGNGPMAAYLTVKPPDLTRIAARRGGKFPRRLIGRIIAGEKEVPGHGTRTMPVWGERLQDDVIGEVNKPAAAHGRIDFLVDHLQALQGTAEPDRDLEITIPEGAR